MKLIIAGSRTITNYSIVYDAVISRFYGDSIFDHNITEIVSGGANGIDQLGERFAMNEHIPYKVFPAEWEKYNKSAGVKRNLQMAKYADTLLCIWDGISRGSKNMIKLAKENGLDVHVEIIE